MPQMHIEIEPLTVKIDGPLTVGTGFRRGLIHRTVERDTEGLVYVPASSLKGRIRAACEQLARHSRLPVCQAPHPENMCSIHRKSCLVCRIFGSPGLASGLHWRDALLRDDFRKIFQDDREAQIYHRTQVQLSRALGTATADRLFISELSVEGLCFETGITGWLEVTPIAGDSSTGGYELLLLLAGIRFVNTMGGGGSKGNGWCTVTLPEKVKINDHEVLWQSVLEQFDLLSELEGELIDGK